MSVSEQLGLFEEEEGGDGVGGYFSAEAIAARKKEYRRNHKTDYRKFNGVIPIKNGIPFVIVPEIAPILEKLAEQCAREADQEFDEGVANGLGILAARAAVVMSKEEKSVVRRLHNLIHKRQLFVNANDIEGFLMAMDAEHEYDYGVWPSCRADALERVSIEAEMAGKNLSPTKLLAKANQLYDKGIRKALKRAVEVRV